MKTRFRHLLVGMDEQGLGEHAAHAAAELARAFACEAEIACAVPVPPAMWIGIDRDQLAQLHSSALSHARERVEERLREAERHFGLVEGELVGRLKVYPGKAGKVLLARAEELPADVIFLGSHAKRGLIDFGKTARQVLHHARCGLWVQPVPCEPIERILAPVDLSDANVEVLGAARLLAERLNAEVRALHCFVPPTFVYPPDLGVSLDWENEVVAPARKTARAAFDALVEGFEWGDVVHRAEFVDGTAEDTILERSRDVQLVVVGSHGRSGLAAAFLGDVAYGVVRRAEVGVLALRG